MNIDLLITQHGESGLLCDRPFEEMASGVIFDAETREITVEFGESGETFHLNIHVEEELREMMLFSHNIQLGMLDNGLIAESIQSPLLYLNDPYGSDFGQHSPITRPSRSLIGFEQFMKRCVTGQPVHRENLADEGSAGCVLRGMDPAALQYVPQLVRQRMLEASPHLGQAPGGPNLERAPGMAPGGGSHSGYRAVRGRPPKDSDQD